MSKSRATGWQEDAPSAAQIKELFAQIESGRITKSRMQTLLRPSNTIRYEEAPSISVGKMLQSEGFDLAYEDGQAMSSPISTSQLGILKSDPTVKPRKFIWILLRRNTRRHFLGVVHFAGIHVKWGKDVDKDVDWVFEVYGHEYVDQFKRLAEEMAALFNVKIYVRLQYESPKSETFLSDFSDW